MSSCKVGFIGTGNIASAIFSGITASGYIKSENVYVFDTDTVKSSAFVDKGATALFSCVELVKLCDYVFLTVKPQVYSLVLSEVKTVAEGTCFIDVAAGISISHVKELLGFDAAIVRAMPNTPLMCGLGSTALVKVDPVSDVQFDFVRGCFESSGVTIVVDESKINVITAISGSAPAYVMKLASNIIEFGVKSGLSSDDAKKLVLQVFAGSAKLAKDSSDDLEQLIKNVTSPNGTTEAGLKSLASNNFDDTVSACLEATVKRAEELAK